MLIFICQHHKLKQFNVLVSNSSEFSNGNLFENAELFTEALSNFNLDCCDKTSLCMSCTTISILIRFETLGAH